MALYRLLEPHIGPQPPGLWIPKLALVGDGPGSASPWPGDATPWMEGLDDDGRKKVDEAWQRAYGHPAPVRPDAEEDQKLGQQQQKEIEAAAPVSEAQAKERGKPWPTTPAAGRAASASATPSGAGATGASSTARSGPPRETA